MSSKKLTWSKIRAIGELKILTKASYFMLIIVPLVAGVWGVVDRIINVNNNWSDLTSSFIYASEENSLKIQKDLDSFYSFLEKNGESELTEDMKTSITKSSKEIIDQLNKLKIPREAKKYVPLSWALAFFCRYCCSICAFAL